MSAASRHTLAVDIGNSRIKFGLLSADESGRGLPTLIDSFVVKHGETVPWDQLERWTQERGLDSAEIGVASVNPPAIQHLLGEWDRLSIPVPQIIARPDQLDLTVQVDHPDLVGIDRLLHGVAGNALRRSGQPLIIIASGTAGTIDLLDTNGAFVGGSIFSGLEMTARSLHDYTALLPLLTVEELRNDFPNPLGKNTREAMHAGIFWGHVGAVKELVSRMSEPFSEPPALVVTGGAARMLVPHLPPYTQWIPHLVLYGLAITLSGQPKRIEGQPTASDR